MFAFRRFDHGGELVVMLNFSDLPQHVPGIAGDLLVSTHLDRDEGPVAGVDLRGDEGVVVRVR